MKKRPWNVFGAETRIWGEGGRRRTHGGDLWGTFWVQNFGPDPPADPKCAQKVSFTIKSISIFFIFVFICLIVFWSIPHDKSAAPHRGMARESAGQRRVSPNSNPSCSSHQYPFMLTLKLVVASMHGAMSDFAAAC